MIHRLIPTLLLLCTPAILSAAESDVSTAVRTVLNRQAKHWNDGDLEGFLNDYWHSPKLTFSSGGETRRGFKATRERYLKNYATREKMGRLSFSGLEVTPLGKTAAMVLGNWLVERKQEKLAGNFTLVMRKVEGRWVIIHDHTSKMPPTEE